MKDYNIQLGPIMDDQTTKYLKTEAIETGTFFESKKYFFLINGFPIRSKVQL